MSGIAGLILLDGRNVEPVMLRRMREATPFLGHDGVDAWQDGPAGLIRFALRTTPESLTEQQPFVHPGSGAALLFDGRLDNRAELLARLGGQAPPTTAPDGEIVLAAYEAFGEEATPLIAGDYGLALWRPRERRLYLARSPVGLRPLLWTADAKRFAFASEVRTLVDGLGLERRLNEGAIGEHMAARLVTQTDTFWQGVQRLPPGYALALENGRTRVWRWNEGPFEDHSNLSAADHIERFKALFDDAIRAANRSDRPIASHLSGGLDSSSVVCRTHQLHQAGDISRMLQPISTRFYGEVNDEGPWIEAVERQTGVASLHVTPADFSNEAAAAWCRDTLQLPLKPNSLATVGAACRRLTPDGFKVLLTGEGGDDWLNGSRAHWPDMVVKGQWLRLLADGLAQGPGGTIPGKLKAVTRASLAPLLSAKVRARMLRPHLDFSYYSPDWIRPDWARRIDLDERWRSVDDPPMLGGFAQRQRYAVYGLARRYVNFDNVLTYVASRGMELRHPFHDWRLTRFLMGAAGDVLKHGGQRKWLLRQAMRGVLPEEVRNRPGKANISSPVVDVVSRRFAEKNPKDLLPVRLGWVDPAKLVEFQQAYEIWRRNDASADFPLVSHAPVWNAVAMDMWLEHAFRL